MPERNLFRVKKISSAVSTTSTESDMDLLMCTPQFIKEHIQFSKADDLKKNILVVKNRNLFGDVDGDEEDKEDSDKDVCLVQLINVPKNTNDFDKLLPHLKQETDKWKKPKLTKEQEVALEAGKDRDERHATRDRGKEDNLKSHNEEKAKGSTRQKKKD
ncbi:uncharacterized protein LOC133331286 [Musca vetustissima]|uniref:uncharacterized protein LOC133331286 n=1 Tax=Musca vetustissima TaxID=27455 RepID=UPI002AB5E678|nr:uncharacterized protein LOC133331286 [Musca vetustissima]